jgi:hypothetical protein
LGDAASQREISSIARSNSHDTPPTLIQRWRVRPHTRLKALEEIFGEVWLSVLPEVGHKSKEIEIARELLASIIFSLARDGQLGALQITHTAARLMRR